MREYINTMLISPSEVKADGLINYNVTDSDIGYAIRISQDMYLEEILGKALLNKLQLLVYNAVTGKPDNIDEEANVDYAMLLDEYVQPYLASKTVVELLLPISLKIRNIGVSKNSDTNINDASTYDIKYLMNFYTTRSCLYATRLSKFLCENKDLYVELNNNGCCGKQAKIGAEFHPTSIWLGNGKKGCCNG